MSSFSRADMSRQAVLSSKLTTCKLLQFFNLKET